MGLFDIDLHDFIYFTYSDRIREQQLLQNNVDSHAVRYKRAAANNNAVWEKIRKGSIYHLVRVQLQ